MNEQENTDTPIAPIPPVRQARRRGRPPKVKPDPKPKRKGLAADLGEHADGVDTLYYYWVGAFPGCCGEGITAAGIHFQKITETVKPSRSKGGTREFHILAKLFA